MNRNSIAVATAFALTALPALAQKYPAKPIRIVVPYTPGGPTDILARAVGQSMNEAWGQPVIIDNKPGNSGNLGTAQVAKSPADGYTLASVGISYSVAPALDAKLGYDPVKDLTPIALMASVNNLLVVHPSLPAKSVKELIAFAKARPHQVSFASGGPGGAQHLAGELFNSLAGIHLEHIPYKGSAPPGPPEAKLTWLHRHADHPAARQIGQVARIGCDRRHALEPDARSADG